MLYTVFCTLFFPFSDSFYTTELVRSEREMKEWMDVNAQVIKSMKDYGTSLWYKWKKNEYVKAMQKDFEELRQAYVAKRIPAIKVRQEMMDIRESNARKNEYPAYLAHVGHAGIVNYSGVGDTFEISKFYFRKKDKNPTE